MIAKVPMRLMALRTPVLILVLLAPILASCSDHHTYEFWSCDQSKEEIYVMKMPKGYRPTTNSDERLSVTKRSGFSGPENSARPGEAGFLRTNFFSTYPDFEPIASATPEQLRRTEEALVNLAVVSGSVSYGDGVHTKLFGATHELGKRPDQKGFRWREESLDGKYWVYPDPWLRRGEGSADQMTYFLPKDTGFNVVITCKDMGSNVLPPDSFRCGVLSRFVEEPGLACLTLDFRIVARDIPKWRELDATLKAKIKAMLTVRKP